jgi:signal transduction histidine kinase
MLLKKNQSELPGEFYSETLMVSAIHRGLISWVGLSPLATMMRTPVFALSRERTIIQSLSGEQVILLCALGSSALLWLLFVLRLRQLTGQLRARMAERLTEREKVARELHDTLLQSVGALILRFQTAAERIPQNDPTRQMLEEALGQSDEVLEQLREQVLGSGVSSAESNELPQAFAAVCQQLKRENPADFSVVVNGDPRELNPMVRDEVYRIGREAITNSFHHANAGRCETEINYDRTQLRIGFRDDGCGVNATVLQAGHRSGHWGLPGMYERARRIGAELEVWSRQGVGTEVEVRVPAAMAYRSNEHASRWRWLRRLASGGS